MSKISLKEMMNVYYKYRGEPRSKPMSDFHKAIIMCCYHDQPFTGNWIAPMAEVFRCTNTNQGEPNE